MFNIQELSTRLQSGGYSTVAIDCPVGSQQQLERMLVEMAIGQPGQTRRQSRQPISWDIADGLQRYSIDRNQTSKMAFSVPPSIAKPGEPAPCALLRYIIQQTTEASLYIVYDLPQFLIDHPQYAAVERLLKSACTALNYSNSRLILVHQGHQFGSEFQDLINEMEYPLPDESETTALAQHELRRLHDDAMAAGQSIKYDLSDDTLTRIVRALLGLTEEGQLNLLLYSVRTLRAIDGRLPNAINRMKRQQLAGLGIEYAPPPDVPAQGLTSLDGWMQTARATLDPRAKDFNLPNPRSLLLIGPPGTGKSLVCKGLAQQLGLACIMLDFGSLMTKELGGSEQRLRDILKAASSVAPCLLMIDEFDKAITSAGEGDGGISQRMMAYFLRWLNDHIEPVIVVATANRPTGFSPELLRRFTRVFVDLPTFSARREIFKVHMQLRKLMPDPLPIGKAGKKYNTWLDRLAELTEDYTGDEIAQVVINAATQAFIQVQHGEAEPVDGLLPITLEELEAATRQVLPQQRGDYREREMLLGWVNNGMAIHANPPEPVAARNGRRSVQFE